MFDTMTMTKVVGALCGMFLIFLLGKFAAETIYHTGGGDDHGDGHTQAYIIDTGDGDAHSDEPAVAAAPFAEVYASADAAEGEGLFRACKACHKLEDGANGTGPTLYAVVGRAVDSIGGYSYSGALEKVADVWSPDHLNSFLTNPKEYAPGTKMSYRGMSDAEDRANLIAYLATIGG